MAAEFGVVEAEDDFFSGVDHGPLNVNEQTVKKILTAGGAKPLVALVWHAHLSMRVAFKIQTFIMKLPTRDVLPARGGVGFPLSKEEMRWHLNYFSITA